MWHSVAKEMQLRAAVVHAWLASGTFAAMHRCCLHKCIPSRSVWSWYLCRVGLLYGLHTECVCGICNGATGIKGGLPARPPRRGGRAASSTQGAVGVQYGETPHSRLQHKLFYATVIKQARPA